MDSHGTPRARWNEKANPSRDVVRLPSKITHSRCKREAGQNRDYPFVIDQAAQKLEPQVFDVNNVRCAENNVVDQRKPRKLRLRHCSFQERLKIVILELSTSPRRCIFLI